MTDMTTEEMLLSLTGYDELGIKQVTGLTVAALADSDRIALSRALVAVHIMREDKGQGPKAMKAAHDKAQAMTFGEISKYFAEDVEEFDATSPDSASGKGD